MCDAFSYVTRANGAPERETNAAMHGCSNTRVEMHISVGSALCQLACYLKPEKGNPNSRKYPGVRRATTYQVRNVVVPEDVALDTVEPRRLHCIGID